mgnify:CR=1 FL=1
MNIKFSVIGKEYQKAVRKGKRAELIVKNYLGCQGFTVEDISMSTHKGRFHPFDLEAVSPDGRRFIIQVKGRWSPILYYQVRRADLDEWNSYITDATKILVLVTKIRGILYANISDIEPFGKISALPKNDIRVRGLPKEERVEMCYTLLYKNLKHLDELS